MTYLFNLIHYYLQTCVKTLEINALKYINDPAHFLSAPGLAWQACLKKTGVELELLTDNDMLMMCENGIRGGMCNAVIDMLKQIINTLRILIKMYHHHIWSTWMQTIYMDGQCHKSCL